jgi:hypothetical protein
MGGRKVKRAIRHRVNLLVRVRPTSSRLFTHSASARGGIQACPRAQQRNRAVVTQAARRRTRRPSQKAGAARAQKLTWWLCQTPARCDRPCSRGAPHTSQCVHDASSADTGCFAWSLLGLLSSMCRAESERRPISCDARPCTGQRRDQPPCLSPQEEYNTKIMYNHHRSHRRATFFRQYALRARSAAFLSGNMPCVHVVPLSSGNMPCVHVVPLSQQAISRVGREASELACIAFLLNRQ